MPNTIIATQLAVDPALVMDANYQFDPAQRRYIDDQIRAIEQLLVDNLINGRHGSWFNLSGASEAVIAGDTVCLSGAPGYVTKCTQDRLDEARSAIGVVVSAASPGGKVLVAISGVLTPSITQLAVGTPGYVKVTPATSRLEVVSGISIGDVILGTVDYAGWMHIMPSPALGGQLVYGGTFARILSIPATIATADDTPTTITSFQMTDESVVDYDFIVTACTLTTAAQGGRWKRSTVYRMTGGISAIIGTLEAGTDEKTDIGLDVTIVENGTGLFEIQVTGIADTDINWFIELRVQESRAV